MARDIENWCKQCPRCLRRKATGTTAPLVNIVTSQPLELVCMDYLTVETSSGGYQHMLVITTTLRSMLRQFLIGTRQQGLQPKLCSTVLSFTMESPKDFIRTKELTLSAKLSKNSAR